MARTADAERAARRDGDRGTDRTVRHGPHRTSDHVGAGLDQSPNRISHVPGAEFRVTAYDADDLAGRGPYARVPGRRLNAAGVAEHDPVRPWPRHLRPRRSSRPSIARRRRAPRRVGRVVLGRDGRQASPDLRLFVPHGDDKCHLGKGGVVRRHDNRLAMRRQRQRVRVASMVLPRRSTTTSTAPASASRPTRP